MEPVVCRSKSFVDRANGQVAALESVISSFLADSSCEARLQQDAPGQYRVALDTRPLPGECPVLFGSIVRNFRFALDEMARDITRYAGEAAFPAGRPSRTDARHEAIGETGGATVRAAGPAIFDRIVNALEPYRDGNDVIWMLRQFGVMEEHAGLLVAAATALTGVCGYREYRRAFEGVTLPIGADGRLQTSPLGARVVVTNYGAPDVQVVFANGSPCEGEPLLPLLRRVSEAVSKAVETMEEGLADARLAARGRACGQLALAAGAR